MPRKHNRTGRANREARHVRLYHWMLNAPAYLSLKAAARAILIELHRIYDGRNNGRIGFSVRMGASRCRITKTTAARALADLVERGFIECVTPGAFSRKIRHATEWRLTCFPCDVTGKTSENSFMRWGREKQNTVPNEDGRGPKPGPLHSAGNAQ